MRCLTLADALKQCGARIRFISRELPVHLRNMLVTKGMELVSLEGNVVGSLPTDELVHAHWLGTSQAQDAEATIQALSDQTWDWLIVDHYALDARWESAMRQTTKKIMVIDDIADRKHDCDVLLDQNFYADMQTRYVDKVPAHCQLLLGPRYALLRDEFRKLHEQVQPRTGSVKRILVFFGGVDADNYTGLAIDALAGLSDNGLHVDAVSYTHLDVYKRQPYVIRKFGATYFQKYKGLKKGHFRCTIDCLDDYLGIQMVFSDVDDLVHEPSFALVNRLEKAPFQPMANAPVPKLVLGAAQLGGNYGIANTTGQPNKKQCQDLIKTAIANGVVYLDTAHAYGNSEAMIGQSLEGGWAGRAKIITKLSPLQDCQKDASISTLHAFVDASIYKSCSALRVQKIDVLMLHRVSHLFDWSGSVWNRLLELQSLGVISELGASVQNPTELSEVLSVPEINYIQLPFNLLDWRWDSIIPEILATKASRKLIIHVRSALLQGLLPSMDKEHWLRANVEQAFSVREWLLDQVITCQRANIADLCLSYINALAWVDGIAIGMDNMSQLIENINCLNLSPLSADQVESIQNTRPKLGEATLNPALWRKA